MDKQIEKIIEHSGLTIDELLELPQEKLMMWARFTELFEGVKTNHKIREAKKLKDKLNEV